jgi:hypothetical protein
MNPEIVNPKIKYVCPFRALNSKGIATGETLSKAEVEQARDIVLAAFGSNNVHGIDWEGSRIFQAETKAVFDWYLEEVHLTFLPLIKATREIEYFFTNHEPYMYLVEKNDKASVPDLHRLYLTLFPSPDLSLRVFDTVFQRFMAPFYTAAWFNCASRYWKNLEPTKFERVFQNQFWFNPKTYLVSAYESLQPTLDSSLETLKEVTQKPELYDLSVGSSMEMRLFHKDRMAYLNALPDHFSSFKRTYGLQLVHLAKEVSLKGDPQLYHYILQKSLLLNQINELTQDSSNVPVAEGESASGIFSGLLQVVGLLMALLEIAQLCSN